MSTHAQHIPLLDAANMATTRSEMNASDFNTSPSPEGLLDGLVSASAATANHPMSSASTVITPANEECRVSHRFQKLPTELRLKIWKEARPEARVIKIKRGIVAYEGNNYPIARSSAKVPSLLHVNFESRKVALEWYTWLFPKASPISSRVYFDHSRDWVYFSCDKCKGIGCTGLGFITCGVFFENSDVWLASLKRVAVEVKHYHCRPGLDLLSFSRFYKNVDEAMLVDGKKSLGSRSEAPLSEFKITDKMYRELGYTSAMNAYRRWAFYRFQGLPIGTLKKLEYVEVEGDPRGEGRAQEKGVNNTPGDREDA